MIILPPARGPVIRRPTAMNRRLSSALITALAAGLLGTTLTGAADAATTAAATTGVATAHAPAAQPPATSDPSENRGVVVDIPRDAPATVHLARGFATKTIFSVSLYENPSTGYSWSQSVSDGATGPVTFLDTDYVQDPAAAGQVGVGGTRYFRYLVTSGGSTTITFVYRRPWETEVAPVRQVTLTIYAW
jgi:predicted secreted protein